jgi:light-regulated signal transduction histidine kinase (bacteriophytochrome)
LDYSRIANQEIQRSPVDFQEVLEEVSFNLNVLIRENQARIDCQDLPILEADKTQMVRIFQNLISNSIKYRGEDAPWIRVKAREEGDQVVFSVQDNGIGIDPQHLESIFTIFSRLHRQDQYPGTGMGLAIVQRIVHQHGGEIWAESEGDGSTFYFSLPMWP